MGQHHWRRSSPAAGSQWHNDLKGPPQFHRWGSQTACMHHTETLPYSCMPSCNAEE